MISKQRHHTTVRGSHQQVSPEHSEQPPRTPTERGGAHQSPLWAEQATGRKHDTNSRRSLSFWGHWCRQDHRQRSADASADSRDLSPKEQWHWGLQGAGSRPPKCTAPLSTAYALLANSFKTDLCSRAAEPHLCGLCSEMKAGPGI